MLSKEVLDELYEMNAEFNEKQDEFYGFSYETNGWYECIRFNEHVLWDNEDSNCWLSQRPDFDYDEDEDDHDPDVIHHVKMRFNDMVNKLKTCRYDVKSKKTENSTPEDAVHEIIDDLSDRRGLGQEWDQIDEDIQQEIMNKWMDIIEKYN